MWASLWRSQMRFFLLSAIMILVLEAQSAIAQTPMFRWAKCVGNGYCTPKVTVGLSGNSYVVGSFADRSITIGDTTFNNYGGMNLFVAKYDSGGNVIWARTVGRWGSVEGWDVAVDSFGNCYVSGRFDSDTLFFGTDTLIYADRASSNFVLKYDVNGDALWARSAYAGYFLGWCVCTDKLGNCYVGGDGDWAMKYDPSGNLLWSSGWWSFEVYGIGLDKRGNLYEAGTGDIVVGLDSLTGILLVKYDTSGNIIWARSAGGSYLSSYASGLAVDDSGNCIVTGQFHGTLTLGSDTLTSPSPGCEVFIAKYDSNGNVVWARSGKGYYNGGAYSNDAGRGITVDKAGYIYVTGDFEGPSIAFGTDTLTTIGWGMFLVKYDFSGNVVWTKSTQPVSSNSSYLGRGVALDASGNCYVAGSIIGGPIFPFDSDTLVNPSLFQGYSVFLAKVGESPILYDVDNNWNLISVPLVVSDFSTTSLYPSAISEAFAYHGGYITSNTLQSGEGYWIRFSGNQSIPMTGSLSSSDTIEVSDGWNLIGSISVHLPTAEVGSIPAGMITSQFFGFNRGYTWATEIEPGRGYWVRVNGPGKLVLTTKNSPTSRIQIVATSQQPPPPPSVMECVLPRGFSLKQNYPNPFNPNATIEYELPTNSRVSLTIYDVLGQIVAQLVNGIEAGYKQVSWNASGFGSGVYFYRLEATSLSDPSKTFSQTRKMLLIR